MAIAAPTVAPGVTLELAQGMFATPGEPTVFMRLSTDAGDILPDAIILPRGLALKVRDADGASACRVRRAGRRTS